MKTAVARSPILQKTITTRQLTVDPDPQARSTPDFWEYIESLTPEDWDRHVVYIYRTDPRSSNYGDGQSNIDKCPGYIEMRDGTQVQLNDREEVERAIQEKHGGRAFRLIVKRGHERVTEGKSSNDAPPKFMHQPAQSGNGAGNGSGVHVTPFNESSATADVAKQAITTMAGQDRAATEVAISALRGAAEVVQRLAAAPSNSAADDPMRQAMTIMLQKMMNRDPLEEMTRLLTLMNTMRGPGGTPAPSAAADRIIDVAIERMLNPVSGTPPVNASAELVRQLPSVAGYVTEAIREWRLGTEAQRDTAALMSRGAPGAPPNPQPGPRNLPASSLAQPAAPTAPVQQIVPPASAQENRTMASPPLEFVEAKILEIFNEGSTAEEAAEECFLFLDRMDQKLVAQLAAAGESGIMTLFSSRPLLRPATTNLPRLTEFIRAFLRYARESFGDATPPIQTPGTA